MIIIFTVIISIHWMLTVVINLLFVFLHSWTSEPENPELLDDELSHNSVKPSCFVSVWKHAQPLLTIILTYFAQYISPRLFVLLQLILVTLKENEIEDFGAVCLFCLSDERTELSVYLKIDNINKRICQILFNATYKKIRFEYCILLYVVCIVYS